MAAVMNRCFDWFNQALRDLEKANIDLKYDHCKWACFTAQQAAEKAVNGLLMSRGYDNWGHAVAPMHGRDGPVTFAIARVTESPRFREALWGPFPW